MIQERIRPAVTWLARLALITLAVVIAVAPVSAPEAVPASAPAVEFSSARAMAHVRIIAREPHPAGTVANAQVREYLAQQLRELGLVPQFQHASAVTSRHLWPAVFAGQVTNVVARLEGTESTGAVMLSAHYDSVPTGPGAADDGSGVAAILETVRALRAGPPLKNDLIVLFTDGEEEGLLGASAFVAEHPWAREVRVAGVGPDPVHPRDADALRAPAL